MKTTADFLLTSAASGRLRRCLHEAAACRVVLSSRMSTGARRVFRFHVDPCYSRKRAGSTPIHISPDKRKRPRVCVAVVTEPAQEGTRTPTALRPLVPETSASTNSATWARQTRLGATPTRASISYRLGRAGVYARCTRKIPSAIATSPPMSRVPTFSPSSK
jgi:hypothetical protein